jgi:hypothetical protein
LDELDILATSTKQVGRGNLNVTKDEFQYGIGDEAQDLASKADKFVNIVDKSVEVATHVVIEAVAPAVDAAESVFNIREGASFDEHMSKQTANKIDEMMNAESEVGQRVINSLSSKTHKEAPNYAVDATVAVVGSLVPAVKAVDKVIDKIGMSTLEVLADKIGPKLDNSLSNAIQKSSNKTPEKVDYDVDNEAGFDILAQKREAARVNTKAHNDKMADTIAYTGDNKFADSKLFDDLELMKEATRPIEEKSGKGALHVGVSKLTKGLKKVAEGLAELE